MPDTAIDHCLSTTESERFMGSASSAMKALESVATEIAATDIAVLIVGESGTGKQALARRIHEMSPRRDQGVLRVVCGLATPETLTSQVRVADGRPQPVGTIILDGVDELDRECQRKLFHSLPDDDGGSSKGLLAARLVSTATQNLEHGVSSGEFRGDLYYRISGVCLRIPPLRERSEDIPLLANFFLAKHAPRFEKAPHSLSQTAIARLADHAWSGNVRELENVVIKMLAIGDEELALADLSASPANRASQMNGPKAHSLKAAARSASRQAERELILKALDRTRWNRKRAAQDLQISYKSLLYKLKQIGLPNPGSE
jgi:two-component system, NtrC family, response regulator AtoC